MGWRHRPLYSLGNSVFSNLFSFLFKMIFMIIVCRAVYKIQPWIRLTLYNPNPNVKLSKIYQTSLSNILN